MMGVSHTMRLQLRVSVDRVWVLLPVLSMARVQRGVTLSGSVFVFVSVVAVDFSARFRSWVHSVGVRKLSMMAAKWSLYAGMGGVVCWKLRGWRVAFGAFPSRKDGGIEVIVDIMFNLSFFLRVSGRVYGNTYSSPVYSHIDR